LEGLDRIPQRELVHDLDHLVAPLTGLFAQIREHKAVPEPWKIANMIPVYKNMG
jgi:hypothetical protein